MKNKITLGAPRRWCIGEISVICMLIGGIGYGLLEVMWRGYTHPSMVITGGICLTAICFINRAMLRMPLIFRCLACTLFVILTEFAVGILVNRILHLGVWDYSASRFHLLGQICLEYSCFWFLLCTALSFFLSITFRKKSV